MPFRDPNVGFGIGAILAPAGIIAMMLRQPKGPLRLLVEAGATTPDGARKLNSIGIPREALVERAITSGVIVKEVDGRCWLNQARLRQRRLRAAALGGGGAFVVIVTLWALVHFTTAAPR